jgi:hypothetical protein
VARTEVRALRGADEVALRLTCPLNSATLTALKIDTAAIPLNRSTLE